MASIHCVPQQQSLSSCSSSNSSPSSSTQSPQIGCSSTSASDELWPIMDGHRNVGIEQPEQTISRSSLISSDSGNGNCSDQEEADQSDQQQQVALLNVAKMYMRSAIGNGREKRKERPHRCAICARAASCCHFDVPCCLGCRSFFRRSVLSFRQYKCHKGDGQCRLDKGEICRSCRLDRCILAGMNPRRIQDDSHENFEKAIASLECRKIQLLGKQMEAKRTKNDEEAVNNDIMKFEPHLAIGELESQSKLLESLLYVDDKLIRIRYSETDFEKAMYRDKGLLDILQDGQNVLAKADTLFSKERRLAPSLEQHIAMIQKGYIEGINANYLFIDCYLGFELFKTLPFLGQLPIEDQITLIANNALAAVVFSQTFYSMQMSGQEEAIVFPNGFSPICFTLRKQLMPIKLKMFCKNLQPMKRVGLRREEFLLLRTMLLLQTAAANLSQQSCSLLQTHLEHYSKALMQYERWRLGDLCGVQRYAELMFLTNLIREIGYQHQGYLAYVTTVMDAKCVLGHPDFMDNVIFGIVGKPSKSANKWGEHGMSERELSHFIRTNL